MFYIVSTFYLFILVCDDLALVGSPLVCAKECLRNDKKKKKKDWLLGARPACRVRMVKEVGHTAAPPEAGGQPMADEADEDMESQCDPATAGGAHSAAPLEAGGQPMADEEDDGEEYEFN